MYDNIKYYKNYIWLENFQKYLLQVVALIANVGRYKKIYGKKKKKNLYILYKKSLCGANLFLKLKVNEGIINGSLYIIFRVTFIILKYKILVKENDSSTR